MRANSYSALCANGAGTSPVGAPVTGTRARARVRPMRDGGAGFVSTAGFRDALVLLRGAGAGRGVGSLRVPVRGAGAGRGVGALGVSCVAAGMASLRVSCFAAR